MVKVITYGTYDLLHYGHIRLLERAKLLGDYLIVGVTADDFDKTRGKINVQQSLMERVEAVRATGIADEIIIEEYEGQKIDDIIRLDVDIFAIGSDWKGTFDYLNEYCKVVYLERTQGISSSEIRTKHSKLRLGIVGKGKVADKFIAECKYVNGIDVIHNLNNIEEIINEIDAVYIYSHPTKHYEQVKYALEHNKHVLCELPLTLKVMETQELFSIAKQNDCILSLGCKTAYSTAFQRMMLLAKGGKIGDIVSVDATCTSLIPINYNDNISMSEAWNSLNDWGPIALLPVFQLLGTNYVKKEIISRIKHDKFNYDEFTKCTFLYTSACASIKVGKGVKSEGELIISGTKGYIYVPAPWWKTDYFEIRYENSEENKRYFYQLDGEGIRYEIVAFVKAIQHKKTTSITQQHCEAVSKIMEDYINEIDVYKLNCL